MKKFKVPTTSNDRALFAAFLNKHTNAFKAKKFLAHAFAGCSEQEYRVVAGVSIDEYEAGLTTLQLVEVWAVVKEAEEQNREGVLPSVIVPPKYFGELPEAAFAN